MQQVETDKGKERERGKRKEHSKLSQCRRGVDQEIEKKNDEWVQDDEAEEKRRQVGVLAEGGRKRECECNANRMEWG